MKTKTKDQGPGTKGTAEAQWRRAVRKAYPEGGPMLAAASNAQIERELICRALARTDKGIAALEAALVNMRIKQDARRYELLRLSTAAVNRKERAA